MQDVLSAGEKRKSEVKKIMSEKVKITQSKVPLKEVDHGRLFWMVAMVVKRTQRDLKKASEGDKPPSSKSVFFNKLILCNYCCFQPKCLRIFCADFFFSPPSFFRPL